MKRARCFHRKVKLTRYFLQLNGETKLELEKELNKYCECKGHLQVFDLQGVHVKANDVAGGGEAVAGLDHMTELGLSEELLLC